MRKRKVSSNFPVVFGFLGYRSEADAADWLSREARHCRMTPAEWCENWAGQTHLTEQGQRILGMAETLFQTPPGLTKAQ